MKISDGYSERYVSDPDTQSDAVSKIDEKNLQQIADDLQLDYLNVKDASDVSYLIETIKNGSSIRMEEAELVHYEDIYYYLAMGLVVFLAWETVSLLLWRKL